MSDRTQGLTRRGTPSDQFTPQGSSSYPADAYAPSDSSLSASTDGEARKNPQHATAGALEAALRSEESFVLPWVSPRSIFLLISTLFWGTILLTYVQYKRQQELNADVDNLQSLPCNPSDRILATCAHRGNAAELLSSRSSISVKNPRSVLQQMSALWPHGISCFDFDVVRLASGDLIIGHPGDLVQIARNSTSRSSKAGVALTPGLLHTHTLSELRAAGIDSDAAPPLQAVMQHFSQLRHSKANRATALSELHDKPLSQAIAERNWQNVPALTLELKGPAASDVKAWEQVATTAHSFGAAESVILWLRQMPGSTYRRNGDSDSDVTDVSTVLQLAQKIKDGLEAKAAARNRPLLGLIVPDMILQSDGFQQALMSIKSSRNRAEDYANAATVALLQAAVGLKYNSSAASGYISNKAEQLVPAAVQPFDVLAPSIRLPASMLAQMVTWKPVLTWTLGDEADNSDVYKATWLGLDVGVSNTPVRQAEFVMREQGNMCQ